MIPTTVEPVGDVAGHETDLPVHHIFFVMHCCYDSHSHSAWSEGLLDVVTTDALASVMCVSAWRKGSDQERQSEHIRPTAASEKNKTGREKKAGL